MSSSAPIQEQVHTELIDALVNHSPLSAVREIVERCPHVLQMKDEFHQRTPLFEAVKRGADIDVVQYLVEQRPESLHERGGIGQKPLLHFALTCDAGYDIIRCLIDMRPEAVRDKDCNHKLPAYYALEKRAGLKVLQAVVEPYPQALRPTDGSRCQTMIFALWNFRPLLKDGSSALDRIRYILDNCPELLEDANDKGMRPLHLAANTGAPPEVLSLLLEFRPEALREACTSAGYLPVHYAAQLFTPAGFASFRLLVELWPESLQLRTSDGDLPLQLALSCSTYPSGDPVPPIDRVRYILDKWPQAIRSTSGLDGYIPLQVALLRDAPRNVLVLLLDAWPDSIHVLTELGEPILHVASTARFMSMDTVRLLVERDARIVDARHASDGSLPVHAFAGRDAPAFAWNVTTLDFVRFLVELRPESVLAKDESGRLPVHWTLVNSSQDFNVVQYLVNQRPETLAEKDHDGYLPLHVIAAQGTDALDKVEFLVRQRPESLRAGDNLGNLPIHLALYVDCWSTDVIRHLAEQNPDSLLEKNNNGLSPLHLVVTNSHPESDSVYAADVGILDRLPSVQVAKSFLEHCPDAAAVGNNDGLLPLHLAAGLGGASSVALARCLVGARPDTATTPALDGRVPLHSAALATATKNETSALEVARCLVEHRPEAAMAATLDEGQLPLHCALAAFRGTSTASAADEEDKGSLHLLLQLVQLLVAAAPAALQVKDKKGKIPVQVAASNPCTPLDVLWLLMTAWPASVMLTMVPASEEGGGGGAAPPSVGGTSTPNRPKRPRLG